MNHVIKCLALTGRSHSNFLLWKMKFVIVFTFLYAVAPALLANGTDLQSDGMVLSSKGTASSLNGKLKYNLYKNGNSAVI